MAMLYQKLFLIVFNSLLEYFKMETEHGYALSKVITTISSTFADDFNVVTNNIHAHQRILNNMSRV